jgi:hypothetical protein
VCEYRSTLSWGATYMTNAIERPGTLLLKHGAKFDGIIDDTPGWHAFLLFFAVVVCSVTIVTAFCLALRVRRRSKPIHNHRKIIAIATAIITASSLLHFLFSTADWLRLVATSDELSFRATAQMCAISLTGQVQLLAFSIALASVGVITYILLSSGTRRDGDPQQIVGGNRADPTPQR